LLPGFSQIPIFHFVDRMLSDLSLQKLDILKSIEYASDFQLHHNSLPASPSSYNASSLENSNTTTKQFYIFFSKDEDERNNLLII
jgi:hypothetical protein